MQEEFHGTSDGLRKQLYGWGTINASVWLPSLSELVGVTGTIYAAWGTYKAAMQGLNTSDRYHVDAQGGIQWNYFVQYNASGGGEKIMNACKQEEAWLRSPHCGSPQGVWSVKDEYTMNSGANPPTASHAVHPGG